MKRLTTADLPPNEHTQNAVAALANATKANAEAIGKIAEAIRNIGNATMGHGFNIGGDGLPDNNYRKTT